MAFTRHTAKLLETKEGSLATRYLLRREGKSLAQIFLWGSIAARHAQISRLQETAKDNSEFSFLLNNMF